MGRMVLRNRLATLVLRLTMFILFGVAFGPYVASYPGVALALSTMQVEMGLVMFVTLGFEIVFNLIDLIRHGIRGVAAGPYMPLGLPVMAFSLLSGIFYFATLLPIGAAPSDLFAYIFNGLLIAAPLIDFIFLDEKGTVHYVAVFSSQIYPILYHIFGYFRTVIWNQSPIYGGYMYALPFLDYQSPNIVWNSVLFFASSLGMGIGLVLLGNILAGKYRNHNLSRD